MDQRKIEGLRAPNFTIGRRGYSQREVDNFLARMADWLESDAAEELGPIAVQRKLELVGKSTAQILLKAEEEAERLRRRTDEESAQLRRDAETAAREARRAADEYAKKTRERADEEALRALEAAKLKAKRTVEEAEGRRAQIEGVIAELDSRRAQTLQQLDALREELAAIVGRQRTARDGANPKEKARTDGVAPV